MAPSNKSLHPVFTGRDIEFYYPFLGATLTSTDIYVHSLSSPKIPPRLKKCSHFQISAVLFIYFASRIPLSYSPRISSTFYLSFHFHLNVIFLCKTFISAQPHSFISYSPFHTLVLQQWSVALPLLLALR